MKSFLLIFFLLYSLSDAQIVINEILASNISVNGDEFKDFDDWIEIYNQSDNAVDIGGYFISDDGTNPTKWQIPTGHPATIIEPDSFLLLWADSEPAEGPLHLDFKLSSAGEDLLLVADDGLTIIDIIAYPVQTGNYSYGRSIDDNQQWKYFSKPSPLKPNTSGYNGITDPPLLSPSSGLYDNAVSVTPTTDDTTSHLYYSKDGTDPSIFSEKVVSPVVINQSSVISVRAFKDNYIPSWPVSNAYHINESFNFPVMTIITDPVNLFSDSIGIYTNYNRSGTLWERPAYIHYAKPDDPGFSIRGGLRIQGSTSRFMAKKSFRLFFKTGYGQDQLEYPVFTESPVQTFHNLVFRSGYDDDITTSTGTLLRDPLVSAYWRKLGGLTADGNWTILYLNNDYWGLYNLRESINEYFIQDHFGYDEFDLLRYNKNGPGLQWGSMDDWNSLWAFFENHDFSDSQDYITVKSLIDIENFLNLQALVQCTEYRSWGWGVSAFKGKYPGARWQWTIWDMDRAFTNYAWNGVTYYQNTSREAWGNLMVKKMLNNREFRFDLINRISDYLNKYFKPDQVHFMLDSLANVVEPEINKEAVRWNSSYSKWSGNVDKIHTFADRRPDYVFNQMRDYFGFNDPDTLTIELPDEGGIVKINSITVDQDGWQGRYFSEVPVTITAKAAPGFEFSSWSNTELPADESIKINLTASQIIRPIFTKKFTSNYFEIIAPSVTKTGEKLPLVVRYNAPDGQINSLLTDSLALSNNYFAENGFKIKKGAGTLYSEVLASSSFSLQVDTDGNSKTKDIIVDNNRPQIAHGGTLDATNMEWDSSHDHFINSALTIPQGGILTISAGTRVIVAPAVNMIINGTLKIEGTQNDPVIFMSADSGNAWGGIEFYASSSTISYCFFVNAGGDNSKGWAHTGTQPILFAKENSELLLDNAFIMDSPGKACGGQNSIVKFTNCITTRVFHGGEFHYTYLHVNKSYLMDIPNDDGQSMSTDDDNDGFHIDYVNTAVKERSLIENSFFISGKDDAIDHHQTNLTIRNVWINDWIHEGVATSGADTVKIFNTIVQNCSNGFEAGWGRPQLILDHCVALNNKSGLRFGDSYNTANTGHITATNSVFYNNNNNVRNYTKHLAGPLPGAIDVSFSMTNTAEYDTLTGNMSGIPLFDAMYRLLPESPGASMGTMGTNMGLIDELPSSSSTIVINEIMYKAPDNQNSGDWIELYNPATYPVNLSGWSVLDDKDSEAFQFPSGTQIPAKSFLVVCEDSALFSLYYPQEINFRGNFIFGLSRDGDQVRLYSPTGSLVDSVNYLNMAPWPDSPDGQGTTLELLSALDDNALPQAWAASDTPMGTPGFKNSVSTAIKNDGEILPQRFRLYQNYPNPFNPATNIKFDLFKNQIVSINIFNVRGQKVQSVLKKQPFTSGTHTIRVDLSGLASGPYFYQFIVHDAKTMQRVYSRKMLFLK